MIYRENLEKREFEFLSPFAAKSLETKGAKQGRRKSVSFVQTIKETETG